MASRNKPTPRRVSAGRFKGELTGSRHSKSGSRRVDSHSNVEDDILKCSLNESGFLGMSELTRPSRDPGSSSSSSSSSCSA